MGHAADSRTDNAQQIVAAMVTWAAFAALGSAFCFALAAALQQREAALAVSSGVADFRLLWRLAHRPIWLAGIAADGLAAILHILALSLGSIALVQPLGVTGLLFAIPLAALLRRQRVRRRDLAAAVVVLAGLGLLLHLFPTSARSSLGSSTAFLAVVVGTVSLSALAALFGHFFPGRPRALLLATGAGMSFGMTAVLIRALLQMPSHLHSAAATVYAALGIALLVPSGYLLLQNAYRTSHFAASLATAVVIDPLAAIVGGVYLLHEPLPETSGQTVTVVLSAIAIVAGIAALVRSPSHLFTMTERPSRSSERTQA